LKRDPAMLQKEIGGVSMWHFIATSKRMGRYT
jgi:hypothetical protein